MGAHEHSHAHGEGHSHDHDHGGEHGHAPAEDYAARRHPEFVVLDIGDDVGALIIHTDPEMHGVEIEISPHDDDDARSHKQVLERSAGGRPEFTAVFDGLSEGAYTLWVEGTARARGVAVDGGRVGRLDWRSAGRAGARTPARAGG